MVDANLKVDTIFHRPLVCGLGYHNLFLSDGWVACWGLGGWSHKQIILILIYFEIMIQ